LNYRTFTPLDPRCAPDARKNEVDATPHSTSPFQRWWGTPEVYRDVHRGAATSSDAADGVQVGDQGRVAILKPDGRADLILGTPAIRAVCNHFGQDRVTLYVGSDTTSLAEFLFQGLARRVVDFPHLSRCVRQIVPLGELLRELETYDLVFSLCEDLTLRSVINSLRTETEQIVGDEDSHETLIQKNAVCRRIPNYSRTSMFSGRQILWPERIGRVGLVLQSGDPLTDWPLSNWLELALLLAEKQIVISLMGEPADLVAARFVSRALGRRPHEILTLNGNVTDFLESAEEVDLVVATDGFLPHLCSLSTPIVSLQGPTPWQRTTPFGSSNLVVITKPPCSPCTHLIGPLELNVCVTRECLLGLTPKVVCDLVGSGGVDFSSVSGVCVQRGLSHLDDGL